MSGKLVARAAVIGLVLAGCGSSASSRTSAAIKSPISASSPTSTSTSTTAAAATRTHNQPPSPSRTRLSTTTSATPPTSSAAAVQTAPSPTPAGTPSPPDGLAPTSGYGTYELCAGGCAGSVPVALRRRLHLPPASGGSCPLSARPGPAQASPSRVLTVQRFLGSAWLGARVRWTVAASYTGPLLIRGRRLDDSGAVGFGEGRIPYDELQLLSSGQGAPAGAPGGRAWLSITRVKSAGCYAYQVDGTSFSSVIGFRAAG